MDAHPEHTADTLSSAEAEVLGTVAVWTAMTVAITCTWLWATLNSSRRVLMRPCYALLTTATVLGIVECVCALTMQADLLRVQRLTSSIISRHVVTVALLFALPILTDSTIVFRLLAFYPSRSMPTWRRVLMLALPVALKPARIAMLALIAHHTHSVLSQANADWLAEEHTPEEAEHEFGELWSRINREIAFDSNLPEVEMFLQLFDQLYSCGFLFLTVWSFGWRSGMTVSRNKDNPLLRQLSIILYACVTTFVLPVAFLIALLVMLFAKSDPMLIWKLFCISSYGTVAATFFAVTLPMMRTDRKHQAKNRHGVSSVGVHQFNSMHNRVTRFADVEKLDLGHDDLDVPRLAKGFTVTRMDSLGSTSPDNVPFSTTVPVKDGEGCHKLKREDSNDSATDPDSCDDDESPDGQRTEVARIQVHQTVQTVVSP